MQWKKHQKIIKPKFALIFIKTCLIISAICLCGLYCVILSELQNRNSEIEADVEFSFNSLVSMIDDKTEALKKAKEEGKVYNELYMEYKNLVEFFININGHALLVDMDGNDGKPKILTDYSNPKVYYFYHRVYNNKFDFRKVFEATCYNLYQDDPELITFVEKEIKHSRFEHKFTSNEIYINEKTKEFIPIEVSCVSYENDEVLSTYEREKKIPDEFVKDEAGRTDMLFVSQASDYKGNFFTNELMWNRITSLSIYYNLGHNIKGLEKLTSDIKQGKLDDCHMRGISSGNCYTVKSRTITLLNEYGEMKEYKLYWATEYNLWEVYQFSIFISILKCIISTIIFSLLLARIIYLNKYSIWQQNMFERTLTNAVAHDLKTPLMVISGMTENLKECITGEKPNYYADQVLDTVNYMNKMIEDILDLNRVEGEKGQLRMEQVNLRQLLQDVSNQYGPLAGEKNIAVFIEGEGSSKGDYSLLRQALGNLMDNAVKYTPDGEKIMISIRKNTVEIINTGVTLPKNFLRKAFDPFTKEDKARSNRMGNGIGLSIAKNIFEIHGMKCSIRNVSQGVSVRVCNIK